MTDRDAVAVTCEPEGEGWHCTVTVGDDAGRTTHQVRVTDDDLQRYRPGAADPIPLVRESFVFLLEREPRTSILRSFDLPEIGRYFPEYATEIVRRGS